MALSDTLSRALDSGASAEAALDGLVDATAEDRRDRLTTLLTIYDLHTAPLSSLGDRARWQHHPAVASLKFRLEQDWLPELDDIARLGRSSDDPVAAMRALAARDRLPEVYRWIARGASWPEVLQFLALEGGPDGGFDDLVATCQVGVHGEAKMEMATNYWDEMGDGDPTQVHTTLHQSLSAAIGLPTLPRAELPESALARAALGGLLATNRWLQPEMVGALGLIELQAGPRCRLVLQGLHRLGAPAAALAFYDVHADVDPRHGRDWLDHVVRPLFTADPTWGPRILRGAAWRSAVNSAFFTEVAGLLSADGAAPRDVGGGSAPDGPPAPTGRRAQAADAA
jgi:hypothetical protein